MTTGVTPHQNGAPGRDCAAPAALREDQEGPELPEKLPRELDDGHGDGRDTDEEDKEALEEEGESELEEET